MLSGDAEDVKCVAGLAGDEGRILPAMLMSAGDAEDVKGRTCVNAGNVGQEDVLSLLAVPAGDWGR